MAGAARLTPGRGSPFVQRGGAIRRPEPEERRARLGGAVEPAKLLREIENDDFSQGRHLRNAIEFLGHTEDKKCPELCPRAAFKAHGPRI